MIEAYQSVIIFYEAKHFINLTKSDNIYYKKKTQKKKKNPTSFLAKSQTFQFWKAKIET